jgi:hypothetical protein
MEKFRKEHADKPEVISQVGQLINLHSIWHTVVYMNITRHYYAEDTKKGATL